MTLARAATASAAHGDDGDLAHAATAVDTLVVLMAAGKLEQICRRLITAGHQEREPAAISSGPRPPSRERSSVP